MTYNISSGAVTYDTFFLTDVGRDEIVQKEESFRVDSHEYVVFEVSYKAAIHAGLLFCRYSYQRLFYKSIP